MSGMFFKFMNEDSSTGIDAAQTDRAWYLVLLSISLPFASLFLRSPPLNSWLWVSSMRFFKDTHARAKHVWQIPFKRTNVWRRSNLIKHNQTRSNKVSKRKNVWSLNNVWSSETGLNNWGDCRRKSSKDNSLTPALSMRVLLNSSNDHRATIFPASYIHFVYIKMKCPVDPNIPRGFITPVNPRIALTWAPEGRRRRGRPKETWRRTIEGERRKMGFATWAEAVNVAEDREEGTDQRPYSPRG